VPPDPCPPARARRETAAATAREHALALARCLGRSTARCDEERTGVRAALDALDEATQAADAACPRD
jgi:hypothetical protein